MKSEIISSVFAPPYDEHKQSIIGFIRKTQKDYFSKKIRVCFFIPDTLDPNHESFDKLEFNNIYSVIHDIAEYCEANGMIFDEPQFHNSSQLKVIIYDEKKLKKEENKGKKNIITSAIEKLFDKIAPADEHPIQASKMDDDSVDDAMDNIASKKPSQDSEPSNQEDFNTSDIKHATQSLQFDEILSKCLQVQINEVASRLERLNRTAEEAGFRTICKLEKISIKPVDNEPETIEKLRGFLNLYSREKTKVIYLKQVMENISPVVANFFYVQEVEIITEVELDKETIPNPFANLNSETNTKLIDNRWEVKLHFSYFDQDFDVLSDQFSINKLKEANDVNLDMQLTIQDHLANETNPRIINAPSKDFVIGRSDKVDVQIYGDASAGPAQFSREHLRVKKNGNKWTVICLSDSPVLIDGTDTMRKNDSKIIHNIMSVRLGTSQGIATGEYGIYPEITFNVASNNFAIEITDPSALNT